jgi:heptose I phosphotransferase
MSGAGVWQRLTRGAFRCRQRPDWVAFAGLDWAEHIMERPVTDRFHAKQGRSTGRLVLEAGGRRLVVYLKRHYRLPRWRGLLAALWPGKRWSPALEEWQHLEWARDQGLPVPGSVAAGEFLGPWGRLQSVLAIEELLEMIPLNEAIPLAEAQLEAQYFQKWKRSLVREIARLSRMLHDRRAFQKDHYLCHFYIRAADVRCHPEWRGRVHIIDLHRLGLHRWTWPLWLVKDLAQLLYSSEIVGVNALDRLRFWRAYSGAIRGSLATRLLRRAILFKWRRYRQHNQRSLARKAAEHRQEKAA